MIFAKVAERETIQVVFMRGVAKGTVVGVVGCFDAYGSTRTQQAVELLHRRHHIGQVFNHMNRPDLVERLRRKRPGEAVQITDHIGAAGRVRVNADRPCVFVDAATGIECARR